MSEPSIRTVVLYKEAMERVVRGSDDAAAALEQMAVEWPKEAEVLKHMAETMRESGKMLQRMVETTKRLLERRVTLGG